jgi:hypothetical protein
MTRLLTIIVCIFISSIGTPRADPYGQINHKQDVNWEKAFNIIIKLSAKQNHGHAQIMNGCYSEENKAFCATAIWYRQPTGRSAFMRAIRHGEDNSLFARDVCLFNNDETVRTCISFDNGYVSHYVEDQDGNWNQIDANHDNATSKLWN